MASEKSLVSCVSRILCTRCTLYWCYTEKKNTRVFYMFIHTDAFRFFLGTIRDSQGATEKIARRFFLREYIFLSPGFWFLGGEIALCW